MPITTKERIFVIGMTLVSCAVFAYSVNTSMQQKQMKIMHKKSNKSYFSFPFFTLKHILFYHSKVSGIIGDMS